MPEQPFNSLLPSEDEISKILAQTLKENPSQYATVVLRIEFARLMVICLGKIQDELNKTIKRLEGSIDSK